MMRKAQSSVELMITIGILSFIFLVVGVIYTQYQHNATLLGDAINCEQSVRHVATTINKVSTIPNASYRIELNTQRCAFGVYGRQVYGLYNPTNDSYANRLSEYILTNSTQECQYNASGEFVISNDNGVIKIEKA